MEYLHLFMLLTFLSFALSRSLLFSSLCDCFIFSHKSCMKSIDLIVVRQSGRIGRGNVCVLLCRHRSRFRSFIFVYLAFSYSLIVCSLCQIWFVYHQSKAIHCIHFSLLIVYQSNSILVLYRNFIVFFSVFISHVCCCRFCVYNLLLYTIHCPFLF